MTKRDIELLLAVAASDLEPISSPGASRTRALLLTIQQALREEREHRSGHAARREARRELASLAPEHVDG